MKRRDIYLVIEKALSVFDDATLLLDEVKPLVALRDVLAPKRSSMVLVVSGPNGSKDVGPMSLAKAQEKAEWFKGIGLTVEMKAAPPREVKHRKPRADKAIKPPKPKK